MCVMACGKVLATMCWAGAFPSTVARATGVAAGTAILHVIVLPALWALLFCSGVASGACFRCAELGVLLARVCMPHAQVCACCMRRRLCTPPRGGFAPTSPPAHRFVAGPPPPWAKSPQAAEAACVAAVPLQRLGYNDSGAHQFACCFRRCAACLQTLAWLGLYGIIYGLQTTLLALLLIPIVAGVAAFLLSFLYVPAGALSVLVSCTQWQGHLYTAAPSAAELAGQRVGGACASALAAVVTVVVFVPVSVVGIISGCGVSRSAWAQHWRAALTSGSGLPPAEPRRAASLRILTGKREGGGGACP